MSTVPHQYRTHADEIDALLAANERLLNEFGALYREPQRPVCPSCGMFRSGIFELCRDCRIERQEYAAQFVEPGPTCLSCGKDTPTNVLACAECTTEKTARQLDADMEASS